MNCTPKVRQQYDKLKITLGVYLCRKGFRIRESSSKRLSRISGRIISAIAEAMRKYEIGGNMVIQKWERIYLEEGPEGLSVERRGRGSTGRPPKLGKKVEQDLISEVQRLRAENDYLKKLNALVLEAERPNRRRK